MDTVRVQERVQTILSDVVRRRGTGETVADDVVLAQYPDLAEPLRAGLHRLRMIQTAGEKADELSAANTATFSPEQTPRSGGGLAIHCPHCQATFKTAVDTPLTEINCNSCGNRFSLAGTGKEVRDAVALASLGHFELIERIGIGGFGTVWKGRDRKLDRVVAIKIPRRGSLDLGEVEKFLREARVAAQINHSHIVKVYEVGRDGDLVFIVSEYVPGITLEKLLSRRRPTIRQAVSQCIFVAEALHHAHEQGVVHRDLKPGNIMIGSDGRPRVMDFGLAKREIGEVTMTLDGQLLGTPAYMPPEQALGKGHEADRRSDVYSLGVILFELLTGERPFRGEHLQLIQQVVSDDPPSPRTLNGSVPKDLETITLKCLEKDPQGRYDTAGELAEELRRFLRGAAIQARPIGRIERGWRWAKRQPSLAIMSGVATIMLVASLITAAALLRSRADLTRALGTATEQTAYAREQSRVAQEQSNLARLRADEARRQERQANEALDKLKAEVQARQKAEAARQQAESAQKAEFTRRLTLNKELEKRRDDLHERDTRLKDVTRARQEAEKAAAAAVAERNELASNSTWFQYMDQLVAIDRLLSLGELAGAIDKLDASPDEHRGWEWHYLRRIAEGLATYFDSADFPITSLESITFTDDASAIIVRDDTAALCRIYRTVPLSPLAEIKPRRVRGNKFSPSTVLISPDGTRAVHSLRPQRGHSFTLWDIQESRPILCESLKGYYLPLSAISNDSSLLLVARSDSPAGRAPHDLEINSAETGARLASRQLNASSPVERLVQLELGNQGTLALLGCSKQNGNVDTLCLYHLHIAADLSLTRRLSSTVSFGSYSEWYGRNVQNTPLWDVVRFSPDDELLMVAKEFGYHILRTQSGKAVGHFNGLRQNRAIAISPDNRRVLSMDSEGLVLRDCRTSQELPRLAHLPWGNWQCRLDGANSDIVAIDANWTRCVATAHQISEAAAKENQVSRSLHVWHVDKPIVATD